MTDKPRKIRAKASPQVDTSSVVFVQPDEIVEPIVDLGNGTLVVCEPMPQREVPREGEYIELE